MNTTGPEISEHERAVLTADLPLYNPVPAFNCACGISQCPGISPNCFEGINLFFFQNVAMRDIGNKAIALGYNVQA